MNMENNNNNLSYEQIRENNINRNQLFLQNIGLINNNNNNNENIININKKNNKRKVENDIIPIRRSLRVSQLDNDVNYQEDKISIKNKKENYLIINESDTIIQSTNKQIIIKQPSIPTSDSSRSINAYINLFLDELLGKPIESYGKAAVMIKSQLDNKLVRYNKYSGVVEWLNAFYLWVNISKSKDNNIYNNAFTENGRYIQWYGGSKMSSDSYIIQQLILPEQIKTILLFTRLDGEPYACLGRLKVQSFDLTTNPVSIIWQLTDYEKLTNTTYFNNIITY